jgi:hypothetical protein
MGVAVEGIPGAARAARRMSAEPTRTWWLVALTLGGWALVGTMRYWWAWLWAQLGLISVPVDTTVWIIAIILTILLTPVLWRRFRRVGVVTILMASLLIGGTAIVLSPWHDVINHAWTRMECGPGDCAGPASPTPNYTWRTEKPK